MKHNSLSLLLLLLYIGVSGGVKGDKCPSNIFLRKNSFFFTTEFKRDKLKVWSDSGGKGCACIKDWFKLIFPLFLAWLLHKVKFLTSIVGSPYHHPHLNPLSPPPIFLAKLRLCYYI